MPRQPDPSEQPNLRTRHEVITSLQILTLTAELLAIDLRNRAKTPEMVQQRSKELKKARKRLSSAACRLPARLAAPESRVGESLVSTPPIQEINAFVGMITNCVAVPDIKRDVLAEYVDHLHHSSARLIATIDKSTG